MINNSTNVNKTNNCLLPQNIKHMHTHTHTQKPMTYGIGNPCPGLGQAQKCDGVEPFKWSFHE